MTIWIINTQVGEDRRLILELPSDLPAGKIRVVIQSEENVELDHVGVRNRLMAAGLLNTGRRAPERATRSTEAESWQLAQVFSQGPSMPDIIDEERGPR